MTIILAISQVVLLIGVVWLGFLVVVELATTLISGLRRLKFDLADLLMFIGLIGVWLAAGRVMWRSPLMGTTMLWLAVMSPLVWLIKFGWQDHFLRRQRRREQLAMTPPASFLPPMRAAVRPHRRTFKLRSNANSLLAPRLSAYSLMGQPLKLKE